MKGYLDILKWGYEDRKLLLELLADMNEEIVKMENIINSLFLSSNMEKLKLDIKEIEIKNFLEKIKKDYKLINKNQEITVNVKGETTIKGDRNLLFEAFRGIIDNGIKYSGNRRIDLIAKTLSSDGGGRKSQIIIRDYGTGIPEAEKDKVFSRYYKKNNLSGVGLGLSIIKEIIEVNNGKIELVNRNDGLDVILTFLS